MSLIQLIVERGPEAADARLKGVMKTEEAVAETIENNVRKLIVNESPVDPAYYDKMSTLLDALIDLRRQGAVSYKDYLEKIARLTQEATMAGDGPGGYPASVKTAAQRALYNNLGQDEGAGVGDGCGDSVGSHGWLAGQHPENEESAIGNPCPSCAGQGHAADREPPAPPRYGA